MTDRTDRRIASLVVPAAIHEFLEAAAARSGTDTSIILAGVLGAKPLAEYPEARSYTERVSPETAGILEELDHLLRTANPGSQLVFRQQYIGYRRFDERHPTGAQASRSQIYACLLPRRAFVRMVLPVDPDDYRHVAGITDLSGKGHHGVGDAAIDIHDIETARKIVSNFDAWLGPVRERG